MAEPHQTLRLRDQGDLLEAVPFLLGFHPRESLVVVGLQDLNVCVTLRMDLCDERPGSIDDILAVLHRAGVSATVLVVYCDQAVRAEHDPAAHARGDCLIALPGQQFIEQLGAELHVAGVAVLEALLVSQEHWWSYAGHSGGCAACSDGPRLPGDLSPVAAAATFAGMVAHPDRATLAAVLDPEPDVERTRHLMHIYDEEDAIVQAALDGGLIRRRRAMKRALFASAREADGSIIARSAIAISDAVLCRYAVALSDVTVRDAVWLAIDQGRLDGRGFWQVLLRNLPEPYDCAPLFLFGWAAWRDGNGSLAAIAAERALVRDPNYTAADLLLSAVRHGLDPFRTPRLKNARTTPTSRKRAS